MENNTEQRYTEILTKIKNVIPIEQYQRIMRQCYCELDESFLGFLDIYKPLSELIPKEYTIRRIIMLTAALIITAWTSSMPLWASVTVTVCAALRLSYRAFKFVIQTVIQECS